MHYKSIVMGTAQITQNCCQESENIHPQNMGNQQIDLSEVAIELFNVRQQASTLQIAICSVPTQISTVKPIFKLTNIIWGSHLNSYSSTKQSM